MYSEEHAAYWLLRRSLTDKKTLSPLSQVAGAVFACGSIIRQLRASVNPPLAKFIGSLVSQWFWAIQGTKDIPAWVPMPALSIHLSQCRENSHACRNTHETCDPLKD